MMLVTGANGFIGQNLCRKILSTGQALRATSRTKPSFDGAENIMFDMADQGDYAPLLRGVDVIIHLAARAHQLNDKAEDPLNAFRKVNRDAAVRLMTAAAEQGIRRFVYVSSIGVNGNETIPGQPFRELDLPCPLDPYAISKHEAEIALGDLSVKYGVELVVVRPPLVYGPGAPGNFSRLLKLVNTGLPLPLGAIDNIRSFIYVQNLVDILLICAVKPEAASRTYLVSDGDDISTPGLIEVIAAMTNKPARLISVPPRLIRGALKIVGKERLFDKLTGSLQVDSTRIRTELEWRPNFSLQQGLQATLQSAHK